MSFFDFEIVGAILISNNRIFCDGVLLNWVVIGRHHIIINDRVSYLISRAWLQASRCHNLIYYTVRGLQLLLLAWEWSVFWRACIRDIFIYFIIYLLIKFLRIDIFNYLGWTVTTQYSNFWFFLLILYFSATLKFFSRCSFMWNFSIFLCVDRYQREWIKLRHLSSFDSEVIIDFERVRHWDLVRGAWRFSNSLTDLLSDRIKTRLFPDALLIMQVWFQIVLFLFLVLIHKRWVFIVYLMPPLIQLSIKVASAPMAS